MYRLEDPSVVGGFRYLLVEPFLDGKYVKVMVLDAYKVLGQKCFEGMQQPFFFFFFLPSYLTDEIMK